MIVCVAVEYGLWYIITNCYIKHNNEYCLTAEMNYKLYGPRYTQIVYGRFYCIFGYKGHRRHVIGGGGQGAGVWDMLYGSRSFCYWWRFRKGVSRPRSWSRAVFMSFNWRWTINWTRTRDFVVKPCPWASSFSCDWDRWGLWDRWDSSWGRWTKLVNSLVSVFVSLAMKSFGASRTLKRFMFIVNFQMLIQMLFLDKFSFTYCTLLHL